MKCGVLHRDISAYNVLLAADEKYKGFIHDLDHSTYVPKLDKFARQDSDYDCQLGSLPSEIAKDLAGKPRGRQWNILIERLADDLGNSSIHSQGYLQG